MSFQGIIFFACSLTFCQGWRALVLLGGAAKIKIIFLLSISCSWQDAPNSPGRRCSWPWPGRQTAGSAAQPCTDILTDDSLGFFASFGSLKNHVLIKWSRSDKLCTKWRHFLQRTDRLWQRAPSQAWWGKSSWRWCWWQRGGRAGCHHKKSSYLPPSSPSPPEKTLRQGLAGHVAHFLLFLRRVFHEHRSVLKSMVAWYIVINWSKDDVDANYV